MVNGLLVGAAEFKAMLGESGLPGLSKVNEQGGSAVAGAALTALLYTVNDKEITA
jgi:precorrin-8X/cobalt-precorrin-8 methylmutase